MKSQKQNRHSLMAKGIMVLLSLLVLVFALTYSWFSTANTVANANGLSFRAHGSADFEYAIGFKLESTNNNYVHTQFTNQEYGELNLKQLRVPGYSDPLDLLYDYTPIDITGDGVTLIRPSMDYGNWNINEGTENYSIAKPNVQYISFDLIVRAKSSCILSLDQNSYAKGVCESTSGDGSLASSSSGVTRQSTYSRSSNSSSGNFFSKDAIVGATRVAFVGFDYSGDASINGAKVRDEEQTTFNEAPELLWIPRPDIYLNNHADTIPNNDLSTSGWSLETGVDPDDVFNLISKSQNKNLYSTYVHQYYDVFENKQTPTIVVDNSQKTKASAITSSGVIFNQSSPIMEIDVLDDTNNNGTHDPNEYYYGKVRVRIWIEGTDSESRRALAGGQFSINFDLTTN